jgi:type III restriction enzyme
MGYQRWLKSKEEWEKSGKKPLLFVMADDTESADQIADRLNTDPLFDQLNGKTINLHTNLKGKIKWIGGKKRGYTVFVESEKEIKEDDLAALRKLSRDLDSGKSPYQMYCFRPYAQGRLGCPQCYNHCSSSPLYCKG